MKTLVSIVALSIMATSAPAHAGLFKSLKDAAKKELSRAAKKSVDNLVDRATGETAKGKVEASWKVEEGEAAASNGDGTADLIVGAGTGQPDNPGANEGGGLWNAAAHNGNTTGKPFRQEPGTTVPTADDVLAPEDEEAALLLPAVQAYTSVQGPYQAPRKGMSQNGTTVETADEVQAPTRPQRAKLVQNGTTVATAGEVQAPEAPQRAKLKQNGTRVATASEVQAPTNQE